MLTKQDIVERILPTVDFNKMLTQSAACFAPSNIALIKYWGKRNVALNLPVTSSFSMSLGELGATTSIALTDAADDVYILNDQLLASTTKFYSRLQAFLDLFRTAPNNKRHVFKVVTTLNIPMAAGLASSACGFAALVLALDDLFKWRLERQQLSLLARMGSGSAARSLWQGLVLWSAGTAADGMDSYAAPIDVTWPELCMGVYLITSQAKELGSTIAMLESQRTSPLYTKWPDQVAADLATALHAAAQRDFMCFGEVVERNSNAMHAIMHTAQPSINYDVAGTILVKKQIADLRRNGLNIYYTQDAGPNIKILFLRQDLATILALFPNLIIT